jgi:hypothetical protein
MTFNRLTMTLDTILYKTLHRLIGLILATQDVFFIFME